MPLIFSNGNRKGQAQLVEGGNVLDPAGELNKLDFVPILLMLSDS